MHLDLPTLMVMQSFAMACAGAVLFFAWLQNRTEPVLRLWCCAHISAAAGIIFLMLGTKSQQPLWSALGGCLLSFQSALIWKAARTIETKSAPLVVALLGPAVVALGGGLPILRQAPGSLALATGTAYALAAAISLWRGREERLMARWALIVLTGVHGTALLIGTYSTFTGSTAQDTVPSLTSLFGFIYFESIVFALGTSVFILALIKERNEAASRAAARTDSLTGIANRAAFLASAERILARCQHDNAPVSVMMFDLDRFKAVNDRHGHAIGDAVLREFCDVAAAALRPSDVFGRMGGEEFAVVLPGSSAEAAFIRTDRIRAAFAASCATVGDRQVNATVSAGVAGSANAEESLEVLLEYADAALYGAKTEGRNRVKRAEWPPPKGSPSNVFRVA
jgi:diguanylate cyclase (GGDEF)-like protein